MSKWIFSLIQFFPLSFFALYAFWDGVPNDDRWLAAFQLGALAGLMQLVIVGAQAKPVNRLILGGNLYLIAGGLAAFFHQWWLLQLYGKLQESAIFVAIFIVGLVTTFSTAAGFIAESSASAQQIRIASYLMLAATCLAGGTSMYFQGDRTWAAVFPIICLVLLQRLLTRRIKRASSVGTAI